MFEINKVGFRILETVYVRKRLSLSELIREIKSSPNLVLKYVNEFVNFGVILEEKEGGKRKVHIRYLKPGFNELGKILYSLVEYKRKFVFFEKFKNLKNLFEQIEKVDIVLVYGSYARLKIEKDSDIDILVIGGNKESIKEIFVGLDVDLKFESLSSFKIKINKPLYRKILDEHVVVDGCYNFVDLLSKL